MSFFVVKEVHFSISLFGVFFFHLASDRVLKPHNEVHLGTQTTFIRAEHDGVGSLVTELRLRERGESMK